MWRIGTMMEREVDAISAHVLPIRVPHYSDNVDSITPTSPD